MSGQYTKCTYGPYCLFNLVLKWWIHHSRILFYHYRKIWEVSFSKSRNYICTENLQKYIHSLAMPSQSDVTALPIWRIQKRSSFLLKYMTIQLTRKVHFISVDRYFFLFNIVIIFFWFGSRWVENLRWKQSEGSQYGQRNISDSKSTVYFKSAQFGS